MPVDFRKQCIYTVDYNEMYNKITQESFLDDKELQQQYLGLWVKKLKDADKCISEQFQKPEIKALCMKEIIEASEIFQLPVLYSGTIVYIHFSITSYLQGLKQCNVKRSDAQKIEIGSFTEEHTNFNWTKTNNKVKIKDEPILIVPFYTGEYHKYLVIDGNHRITNAIQTGKKEIEAYCMSDDFLVGNNFFPSEYDKLIYIFQNEIVALGTYTIRDHIAANNLIRRSFLFTGRTMTLQE